MINRTALILRPRQPYIDWVAGLENEGAAVGVGGEHTVYLVPEIDDNRDLDKVLKLVYAELFERELEAWWLDQSAWPPKRTLKLFKEWFTVEHHTIIEDLCDWALVDDEAEAEAEGSLH